MIIPLLPGKISRYLLCFIFLLPPDRAAAQQPTDLTCEYQVQPQNIDHPAPRFCWKIPAVKRGIRQLAYQVTVSSGPRKQGDLWNSGKINSDQHIQIVYGGKPLSSFTRYYWKVTVWTNAGPATSQESWFRTAFMEGTPWQAKWISDGKALPQRDEDFYKEDPAPVFERQLNIAQPVQNTMLYISGLGYYHATLNGQPVGTDVLSPGWTEYRKRVQYNTYNVTGSLKQGSNTISVMLGNGWYNPLPLKMWGSLNLRDHLLTGHPALKAELHITYKNGKKEIIATDEKWSFYQGPVLRNNVYLGEITDGNRKAKQWQPAVAVAAPPPGKLAAQFQEPVRITATVQPVKITSPAKGVYIFDLGQNFAGWIRMKVKGPQGNEVTFRYGELLLPDGNLNVFTAAAGQIKEIYKTKGGPGAPKTAQQEDVYILNGEKEQIFEPRFTFHGFRYVEVSGLDYTPSLHDMEGLRLSADLVADGHFSSSNALLNKIQQAVEWTFLSNVFSVQSDCPAREKFGYGGDIVATAGAYMYNYNMARFYTKAVEDLEEAARPQGGMTETAPYNGISDNGLGDRSGPIGWQMAHPFLQKKLYDFYGDKRIIEAQYPVTRKLISFISANATDHIIPTCIGDHESIAPKDVRLSGTAFYYYMVEMMEEFARILGKKEDERTYATLRKSIRAAFMHEFYKGGGKVGSTTQANQAFGLWGSLLPEQERMAAAKVLAEDIAAKDHHLSTGIFGTKMMLDVLDSYHLKDAAYRITTQETFPGWGYMLANGATTLWEHWAKDDTLFSHNHPMFGSVSEWFYSSLGGIQQEPGSLAFSHIRIRPQVPQGLQWVKTSYRSIRGEIRSAWQVDEARFVLNVSVPGNTRASIYVPRRGNSITEGGKIVWKQGDGATGRSQEVKFKTLQDDFVVFEVGAGDYAFRALSGE